MVSHKSDQHVGSRAKPAVSPKSLNLNGVEVLLVNVVLTGLSVLMTLAISVIPTEVELTVQAFAGIGKITELQI